MKQFFTNDIKDENHILKNPQPKKFFIKSTNENNFIKNPLISYFSSSSDNKSNFSLNSFSDSISSNETNHISNNPYYNDTEENSYISIEKDNKENNQKKFLRKKRKIHFDVLKKCEKNVFLKLELFMVKMSIR